MYPSNSLGYDFNCFIIAKYKDLFNGESMRKVEKTNLGVIAFELGIGEGLEEKFIRLGKIKKYEDFYEVYSKESKSDGEIAYKGDFVKLDKSKNLYPNKRHRFLKYHIHTYGYNYMQYPREILSWTYEDRKDEVIDYLLNSGMLKVNLGSYDYFYEAKLWGTVLWGKKSDIVLIYEVIKDRNRIVDVDFNLIDKDEFDQSYEYI